MLALQAKAIVVKLSYAAFSHTAKCQSVSLVIFDR